VRARGLARFVVFVTLGSLLAGCGHAAPGPPGAVRRLDGRAVEFSATVNAHAFNHSLLGMRGYHAIVWKGGHAAGMALLAAEVTDTQLLDALEALGAKPGNALGMDTWDERKDAKNPAADKIIEGPKVEILLRLPNHPDLVPLAAVLDDPGHRGLDLRLGGHRANIPHWHSGCIVCLYSCPGSKIGNARYTVRDYEKETTRFRAKEELLPEDGGRVGVVVRLEG
jgi:hypothetical protein